MIKVIETSLSIDNEDNIRDHQSRVIEVESWNDYINEIKEGKCVSRISILGHLDGYTLPKMAKVEDLKYDDFHLSYDVYLWNKTKIKKLAVNINA